ncbi:lytic polysaccharide monooxygenase [Streptomyces spectabilis]|uniref:Lytic polysaccharide monooxygenase n=1 Tax=Streptomyces spectabilis TaxID=68270 RepID=A0A516R4X2_STRST|nr:lytic polysaccharide monooxygenase [Streptomyces spectabilis]QDQ10693.1 lytic polysaccharide monooxygenase [Streptomyces spectabilis]
MHARRKVAVLAAAGTAPLVLSLVQARPAVAHGSMTDPVSRVAACFQEGPEAPKSAACKALVRAGGTQPLYDWNEVNIANAAGRSKEIIPNGKLCSAGNAKYKGLDLPRTDWPASKLSAGKHTFRYRATAPHRGSFELYLTKESYDPAKPLTWSDLQARPFAKVTDPKLVNGSYEFSGTVPARSGRHLVYSIWQRSDSPEAFYTCSDVVFGGSKGAAAPAAAPSEKDIRDGAQQSTVEHHGHGDLGGGRGNAPEAKGGAVKPVAATGENLAETGGDGSFAYYAVGGAAALALGSGTLFVAARRRAATNR